MAVLPLRTLPDPRLRLKAKRVRTVDASILKLIDDMIDTMHHVQGVGLAAPQVGKSLRIAVIHVPEQEILVLINPEVVRKSGEVLLGEACLSVPGYRGQVKRATSVTVKALNRQGKEVRVKGTELLGQALQHEMDHLEGKLYIDLLERPDRLEKIELSDDTSDGQERG
ncbi:MAG: peptide deformylase [Dehalococcoidia bacterium]|nr:peptide deformylase [Dehalococcoidia bacterium]